MGLSTRSSDRKCGILPHMSILCGICAWTNLCRGRFSWNHPVSTVIHYSFSYTFLSPISKG